jgi:F-type H+-transporting ATPase subunit delta
MELSSIAKPYAQAIFEVAEQSNTISSWSEFLSIASAVIGDKSTKAFIVSPGKSKNQKYDLISTLIAKASLKDLSKQESALIGLILKNDRSAAIESIASAYEMAVSNANQSKNFKIISAFELSESEKKSNY